ncbi:MAG: NUDIX hydrolase [Pseudomonadota bacterium]
MPEVVNTRRIESWAHAPHDKDGWEAMASAMPLDQPPFNVPIGFKRAAGVVIREPDGRVWVVAPSNGYGGYSATFPKGTMDGMSEKATALLEVFEESGLSVRLSSFLIDVRRSTSYTRYFVGERLTGNPADMGWESQAVMLVPQLKLPKVVTNGRDQPIIEALKKA